MVGFRFDTIGFNNAISLGTRDLIADRIENVMGGHQYDANVTIARDKNIAGRIMAIGRINRPSILVYGGTKKVYGDTSISLDLSKYIIQITCPGAGACGGMYTANTMAYAIEAMGMSLPYRSYYFTDEDSDEDQSYFSKKDLDSNITHYKELPRESLAYIYYPGCDFQHWLILMDLPWGITKKKMIDCYIQTLAKVLGRFGFFLLTTLSLWWYGF
ncbi:dihydroxy-acid dehydratase, chloroplastic-like isoform X1 [Tasmannia lanceolata]|uniref:dihydroxy-acid dehydratase, chloroplastic-like isoform X1 n=1 Tax=Tasmannia lanceolata TaxID=3420 RepID=UPI004062B549